MSQTNPAYTSILARTYYFSGHRVSVVIPGGMNEIGMTSVLPSEEVKNRMIQIRYFLNLEKTKIMQEAIRGVSSTLDKIMARWEFTR